MWAAAARAAAAAVPGRAAGPARGLRRARGGAAPPPRLVVGRSSSSSASSGGGAPAEGAEGAEGAGPLIRAAARAAGEAGSRGSRRLRAAGRLPGVLLPYRGTGRPSRDNVHVTVDKRGLLELLKQHGSVEAMGTRLHRMEIAGAAAEAAAEEAAPPPPRSLHVLLKQARFHPVNDDILAVVFQECPTDGRPVKVRVPVKILGEEASPGVRRGGYLNVLQKTIECQCEAGDRIPPHISIDVSGLDKGGSVPLRDVPAPPGVLEMRTVFDATMPICKISGKIRD